MCAYNAFRASESVATSDSQALFPPPGIALPVSKFEDSNENCDSGVESISEGKTFGKRFAQNLGTFSGKPAAVEESAVADSLPGPTLLYGLPRSFTTDRPNCYTNSCPDVNGSSGRLTEARAFSADLRNEKRSGSVACTAAHMSSLSAGETPVISHPEPCGDSINGSKNERQSDASRPRLSHGDSETNTVDEGLSEVPLENTASKFPVSGSTPYCVSSHSGSLRNGGSNDRSSPIGLLCDSDSVAQAAEEACDKLQKCAISALLTGPSGSDALVSMPTVEDGLSSNSDLDTPHSTPDAQRHSVLDEHRLPSQSPEFARQFMCNQSNSVISSQFSDERCATVDPIVNPPLVHDIWGIMKDIKQTLVEDKGALDRTMEGTERSRNMVDQTPANSLSSNSGRSRVGANFSPRVSCTSPVLTPFTKSQQSAEPETCTKLSVQATIEHSVEEVESQGNRKMMPSTHTNDVLPTRSPQDSPCSHDDRQAQHWTFPTQENTVYSSSEDEVRTADQIRRKTKKSPRTNQPLPTHRASKNATVLPDFRASSPGKNISLPQTSSTNRTSTSRRQKKGAARSSQDSESDEDTNKLLNKQSQLDKPIYIPELRHEANMHTGRQNRVREVSVRHPDFPDTLIHGILFYARYLGSTQLISERQPTRNSRMFQAQEAVSRIKAPDGENQPSVPVELFVSTDRIMILNSNLQEILIDHELRTVSYIADIGELFVLMARRPSPPAKPDESQAHSSESTAQHPPTSDASDSSASGNSDSSDRSNRASHGISSKTFEQSRKPTTKLVCHVLESSEARVIAQSVGHAFHLAYLEFLRENGIEDVSSLKQINYEDVLNQQEIFCDELTMFSDKERHKEIIIPKQRGETLGIVVVSSGWGSLLPTAVLANMHPTGPAARCGQLNIGNHIMSVNGKSLVGLPLASCQQILKGCRNQTSVQLTVVDCPPVVEVLIRRPSLNYQLGFSVQDGVICSLLRGGIAERGGIRVDHRIIEINGQSVVAVPHERIVHLLATSVGEIHIRTMPTSIFRLLTGQEIPSYI
ncbi:unnamed protein product [Calicophoron daubneyi]|uniref:Uncharacterized protein n=1 Tax=Calicophoron daubneyi TaxID=300641 RepID=A0AAV2T982_CALDB